MTRSAQAVVIGSLPDPHVAAVLATASAAPVMTVDAGSISGRSFYLHNGIFELGEEGGQDEPLLIRPGEPVFGWIRRLAPPDWLRGLMVDSHDAAVRTAWLSLVLAVLRTCQVRWLTELDALVAAENKLIQHATAARLGICVPESIVCSDAAAARLALGDEIVLKPIGVGHYYEDDVPFVVYTTAVDMEGPELKALATAPFLAQRRLHARRHLRVVTVCDRIWTAGLEAEGVPLDWRQEAAAHRSFLPTTIPSDVELGARELAAELHLGYSSQDWIVCDDGCYVVDVNPGGQWLFLPDPIAIDISKAIAEWLEGIGR